MNAVALLLATLVAGAQDPEIPKVVRGILDQNFAKLAPAEKLDAAAELVSAAIASARPPEWRQKILAGFPSAAEYTRMILRRHSLLEDLELPSELKDVPPILKFKAPPELMKEGVDLQLSYLVCMVERISRSPWTHARKAETLRQIDRVAETVRATLLEKLPGRIGAEFVAGQIGSLAHSWKESLESPFHQFMDRPVKPEELESVLEGVRKAADPFQAVTLKADEVGNQDRLQELRVHELIHEVRESGYKICSACFLEYAPYEKKSREWELKVDAAWEEHVKSIDTNKADPKK